MRLLTLSIATFGCLASVNAMAATGVLVASGDEWQLSTEAYQGVYATGTQAFVKSLAATFGGSNYLFLSGNSNIPAMRLAEAAAQLVSLGKTVSFSNSFSLAQAQGYDAVFHFGQFINHGEMSSYVNGGGNAYISLGSGWYGTAAAEAAVWNPMLAGFGLVAGDSWFPYSGFAQATVTSGPPGVTSLIWGYGQSIEKISPNAASQSYIRGSFVGGPTDIGLVGASVPMAVINVPEPANWILMIAGFGLIGGVTRQRRQAEAA